MQALAYSINELWVQYRFFSYLLFLFGGAISVSFWNATWKVSRSTYFSSFCALLLAISMTNLIWADSASAFEGDYLWIYIYTVFILFIAIGFLYGLVSAARSRDFSNRSLYAIFAFIPLLNVYLFFKRNPAEISQVNQGLKSAARIAVGICCLIGAGMSAGRNNVQSDALLQVALSKPSEEQVAFLVKTRGLEEALNILARNSAGPIAVDDVTTFLGSKAEKTAIVRILLVSLDKSQIPRDLRNKVLASICMRPTTSSILREGGIVVDRYVSKTGEILAEISVSAKDCSN